MAEDREEALRERISRALEMDIPHIYANGFINSLGTGDVVTILERNGRPVAILNLSFTLAKSLALGIGGAISNLEDLTGRTMLTTQEAEKLLSNPSSRR